MAEWLSGRVEAKPTTSQVTLYRHPHDFDVNSDLCGVFGLLPGGIAHANTFNTDSRYSSFKHAPAAVLQQRHDSFEFLQELSFSRIGQ